MNRKKHRAVLKPRKRYAFKGATPKDQRSPLYPIWLGMMQRCFNPKSLNFAQYGGRGITVCERWEKGARFLESDMEPRPSPAHTIDRIDNNGGYTPENCRWATKKEQAQNRRNAIYVLHDGAKVSLGEYAKLKSLSYGGAMWHYRKGHLVRATE